MNRRQQKRDEERAKYLTDYKREKQDVTALLESMNHIEALEYIDRELGDVKKIRKTKNKKEFIKDTIKFLKEKRTEINKKLKQQQKQNTNIQKQKQEAKSLEQKLKETTDMLNYQNFLYFTERKRNVKNEIVEKIEKLQKLKKELENKINQHPVKLEAKQKRLTKKQEKEAKERAEREKIYENIEFESVKLEHAFRDFSTTWLVRRKANERKSRFQHEIVLIDDENTFFKIDFIVFLKIGRAHV